MIVGRPEGSSLGRDLVFDDFTDGHDGIIVQGAEGTYGRDNVLGVGVDDEIAHLYYVLP